MKPPAAPSGAVRRRVIPVVARPTEAQEPAQEATDRSAEEAASKRAQSDSERIVQGYIARIKNPMTAIRARCVQCCNGQPGEVRECTVVSCALHQFRMGTNPLNKKVRDRMAATQQENDDDESSE